MTEAEKYREGFEKWKKDNAVQLDSLLFHLFLEGAKAAVANVAAAFRPVTPS